MIAVSASKALKFCWNRARSREENFLSNESIVRLNSVARTRSPPRNRGRAVPGTMQGQPFTG